MLYSPYLAEYVSGANAYLRRKSGIPTRLVELIVLVSARENNNQFKWAEHSVAGRKAGLDEKVLDIVKDRKPLTGLGEKEAAIIQLGRETLDKRKVSSDTFARALKLFGKQGLVNVVSVMGWEAQHNVLLTAFDQQVRPGEKVLLPIL